MKANPIIWRNPELYDNHIVMIGSFNLICAYQKMIGKKIYESGLADVLLEAGVISVGSMNGVMSGKNCSCAINSTKSWLRAWKDYFLTDIWKLDL